MRSYDGFRFNLDQYLGIDQAADLNHRGSGPDFAKHFAMRAANLFPFGDAEDIDARAHDILHTRAHAFEGRGNVSQSLNRLLIRVTPPNDIASGIGGRGTRHRHAQRANSRQSAPTVFR